MVSENECFLPVTPLIPSSSFSESKYPKLLSSLFSVLIIVFLGFVAAMLTMLFTTVPVRNWKLLVEFCCSCWCRTPALEGMSEFVEQGEHGSSGVWTPDPRPQFSLLAGGDSKKLVTTLWGSVCRMTSGGVLVVWGESVPGWAWVRTPVAAKQLLVVELIVTWGCMVFEARLTIIEV